jgi:hypothetical protein
MEGWRSGGSMILSGTFGRSEAVLADNKTKGPWHGGHDGKFERQKFDLPQTDLSSSQASARHVNADSFRCVTTNRSTV